MKKADKASNQQFSELFQQLQFLARQYTRRGDETDDLVQDLLLESITKKKDYTSPDFLPWARGYFKNHSAFIARTEVRRKRREEAWFSSLSPDPILDSRLPEQFILLLPASVRILANLINCQLSRTEIQYVLGLPDTALRQRFSALRREWKRWSATGRESSAIQRPSEVGIPSGLLRQSLSKSIQQNPERASDPSIIIGSHDPDGHLFTIIAKRPHKSPGHGNNDTVETGNA